VPDSPFGCTVFPGAPRSSDFVIHASGASLWLRVTSGLLAPRVHPQTLHRSARVWNRRLRPSHVTTDHKRQGAVSLLTGIDLVTDKVHAPRVRSSPSRHRRGIGGAPAAFEHHRSYARCQAHGTVPGLPSRFHFRHLDRTTMRSPSSSARPEQEFWRYWPNGQFRRRRT
jgi:hypothetical protein